MQQTIPDRAQRAPQAAALRQRHLTPDDVPAVLALDREVFPPAFWAKAADLHQQLMWAELKGENYSRAMFDGDQLVGYTVVIGHPSVFGLGDRVLFVLRMAVRLRYRRVVVPALIQRFSRDVIVAGRHIEARLRETNSLRTVQRFSGSFRRYGGRITGLAPQLRIDDELMILFRTEFLIARDPVVWGAYQALASVERARRVAAALPRRMLRKLCASLPAGAAPAWARRLSYFDPPAEASQQV
jgi:hypothetical protein